MWRRYQLAKADSERGAISTLVLILFSSGVVVVLLALIVDSGVLQLQRRVSQIAADQVSVAMAMFCSSPTTATDCASSGTNSAKIDAILAAGNRSSAATLAEVCGSAALYALRGTLPECSALKGISRDCVQPDMETHPWWQFWVRAYVAVSSASQTSAAFPLTGRLLGGSASTDVIACSQYAWGPADKIKIANSIVPLAFNPCSISVSDATLIARLGDASNTECSFDDYSATAQSFSKHGLYRWEAGASTGPCANGSTLEIGETICVSARTPTQTGVYYPNSLQLMTAALVNSQARVLLPVVNGLTGLSVTDGLKGSFNTATVVGFVDIKIRGYKAGANSSGTAPASGWNPTCSSGTVICINATVGQKLSTQASVSQNPTTPNFGVTALTPMN